MAKSRAGQKAKPRVKMLKPRIKMLKPRVKMLKAHGKGRGN